MSSENPERKKAVEQMVQFSMLTHARLNQKPQEAARAESNLQQLGVAVYFADPPCQPDKGRK